MSLFGSRFLSILVILGIHISSISNTFGQLTVTGGVSATALAQTLAGPGITVSNAALTGSPLAAGTFNGTASNIGMDGGVILCTGPVTIAPGPNNSGSAGVDNGQPGNNQLNGLANATTYNAVVLEFDFVPLSNSIEFDYVFGSEEYPEYVNSVFNDAFAFFISGPGITGQQNIAVVPGSTTPVTINTINSGMNGQYYVNNAGGATVQYDGFTTVLTAKSVVQACQTYHLKLMIADGGDDLWDSGLFLAEGSLKSSVVQITTTTATADSTAYENCSNATVTFTLSDVLTSDYTVDYNISGTATNGVDYPTIPPSVTIPAGSLSASFVIEPLYDGVTEGIETVIIDVQTSVCGSDTILIYINDVSQVTVQAFGDTAFCDGTAKLWAHAEGGAGDHTFQWSNGSTSDTIYVTPSATTTYTVSANDYCASTVPTPTADVTVTIDPIPVANAGPDVANCAGDEVTLSGTNGSVYEWFDLTNNVIVGTTASITLNPVGNVDYRMVTFNGVCSDTDHVSVTELPAFPANAIGDTAFCAGGTAQLNVVDAVNGTFSWQPTTGLSNPLIRNPLATPTSTTTYTVTITSSSGCVKTDAVVVNIAPAPNVNFQVDDVCLGSASVFSDLTTITSGNIQGLNWDFGDGTTSTSNAPVKTYTADGTYNVKLVATSTIGCSDSITTPTTVHPLPTASFSFANDCQDKSINFQDQSQVTSGTISSWSWNFSNGTVSAVQDPPAQAYGSAGMYAVKLQVQTAFGCTDDTISTLEVYPLPLAQFTFDSVCLGLSNHFTDLSNANGTYPITNWNWAFSDGQSATVQHPDIAFGQYGPYNATLKVTTTMGCTNTLNRGSALVHPLPTARFDQTLKNCLNDTTLFADLSSVPDPLTNSFVQWNWDFGDGTGATDPAVPHIYDHYGIYPVTLSVLTNKGCGDTVIHNVEIFPLPIVDFSADVTEGCQPLRVQFEEHCDIPAPYSISTYSWNLGLGGDPILGPDPMNVYNDGSIPDLDVATYTISLQATSGNGCVSSAVMANYITEYPKPDALFAADRYTVDVLDTRIRFTDKSSKNVNEWYYEFGDGSSSSEQNPTNRFPEIQDTYEVTQYVTTDHGCKDTLMAKVKVEPIFTFYIPNTFTPNADGVNDQFFGQGEGFAQYAMYIYDRWGELIFVSNDKEHTWDGTYKGKQVEQGTYTYYFYLLDWKNDDHEFRGHVTLTR